MPRRRYRLLIVVVVVAAAVMAGVLSVFDGETTSGGLTRAEAEQHAREKLTAFPADCPESRVTRVRCSPIRGGWRCSYPRDEGSGEIRVGEAFENVETTVIC